MSCPVAPARSSRRCWAGRSCSTSETPTNRASSPDRARGNPRRTNAELLLPHQAQLALRFHVAVVVLQHAAEGRPGRLQVADDLLHVAEEEMGGDAAFDHLD